MAAAPEISRCTASMATASPAISISAPSTAAARFSLFSWPYGWSSSAGRAAARTPANAIPDASRSPAELAASESTATDPVSRPTTSFMIVRTAFDVTERITAARFWRGRGSIRGTVVI